jgi:23S rRNA pseudouridine1911/1915/1917 synthase
VRAASSDLEEELYERFKFEVPKGQASLRIDKYLMGFDSKCNP